MYYSAIFFGMYADINLFPEKYPNNNSPLNLNNININELNKKEYVIILSIQKPEIINLALPYIKQLTVPFVIITVAEDWEFPIDDHATQENIPSFGSKEQILEYLDTNQYFKHWFAINKKTPDTNKFSSIPYGLDFWFLRNQSAFGEKPQSLLLQNETLSNISLEAQHFTKRIPKAFCNFHFNFTDDHFNGDRRKLFNTLSNKIAIFQKQRTTRTKTWKAITEYSFVISPRGHGLDCIRTFEALCLGCIVIMKKSCIDNVYTDLPILLIDKWEDITEQLLNETIITYSNKKFNLNKLTFEYWLDNVISKVKN